MVWTKVKKIILSSSLCAVMVCAIAFLAMPTRETQCIEYLTQKDTNYIGDSQYSKDFTLQFRTPYAGTLIYQADEFGTIDVKLGDLYDVYGPNPADLSYGTSQSSNPDRYALYYPFKGAYVFPKAQGPVDHYEMEFKFRMSTMSALCFATTYTDRANEVYQFQPHSLIDLVVFGYYTKDGVYHQNAVGDLDWIQIKDYSCTRDEPTRMSVTPNNLNFWNDVGESQWPMNCKLVLEIDEFPSDFDYFVDTYIFFGRSFFYSYINDAYNASYCRIEELVSTVSTIWVTDTTVKEVEQGKNNIEIALNFFQPIFNLPPSSAPDLKSIIDTERSETNSSNFNTLLTYVQSYINVDEGLHNKLDRLYSESSYNQFTTWMTEVTNELTSNADGSFFSGVWYFNMDYEFIRMFVYAGLMFALVVFFLRR